MMRNNTLRKILFSPKKELGQNFLFDKDYLQNIVANCPIDDNTIIVEIGSGYGTLTNLLAESNCCKVIGLEKDENLFRWLVANNKNKKVVYKQKDALRVDWKVFCSEYKDKSIIIVGNLPYYITNSLIVNLLFCRHLFKSFVFLVQKEVGQKWASSPNEYSSKYSALSVFINHLAATKIGLEIPREVFIPIPEVDGVLLIIEPKKEINMLKEQVISFLRFLKNCFLLRRKTLWNNLMGFAGNHKEEWEKYFLEKHYSLKIRPQNLTPSEYFQLFIFWKKLNKWIN